MENRRFPCKAVVLLFVRSSNLRTPLKASTFTRTEKSSAYARSPPFSERDELLEPVERVGPAVPVEFAARLGLEGTLSEDDLRRLAEIPKRQLDNGLDIVGIWVLIYERADEAGRRVDLAELPGDIERIALSWLHLDPVAASDAGFEFEARNREALRPPPLRKLVGSAERPKDNRRSGGDDALQLEGQLARLRHPPSTLFGSRFLSGRSRVSPG